jgi:hypothetical protein
MKKMINTNLMLLVFVCFTVPFFGGCDTNKMAPNSGTEMAGTEIAKPKIVEKGETQNKNTRYSSPDVNPKLGVLH